MTDIPLEPSFVLMPNCNSFVTYGKNIQAPEPIQEGVKGIDTRRGEY
jgi:hypothetical protein